MLHTGLHLQRLLSYVGRSIRLCAWPLYFLVFYVLISSLASSRFPMMPASRAMDVLILGFSIRLLLPSSPPSILWSHHGRAEGFLIYVVASMQCVIIFLRFSRYLPLTIPSVSQSSFTWRDARCLCGRLWHEHDLPPSTAHITPYAASG